MLTDEATVTGNTTKKQYQSERDRAGAKSCTGQSYLNENGKNILHEDESANIAPV